MRGFQKGITLCIGTSGSAFKIAGGVGGRIGLSGQGLGYLVGGLFNYSVSPVQSGVGVRSLDFEFRVGLDLDWTFA